MERDLLTLVEQDGFRAVRRSTSRGGQYNGPCLFPDCGGGTDRLRVQPNQGTYGWFACTQCGRKGSAVDYLMLKRGLSKGEALATVGWMPKDGSAPYHHHSTLPTSAHDARPQWNEPPKQWQEAATDFYQGCQRLLWSKRGQHALAYLRGRGLSDKTIKGAMLGYHSSSAYGLAKVWGKAVNLPQGIVIPWFCAGSVWRVTVRNETVSTGAGRYTQVAGGSNGLYLADALKKLPRPAVVLVEGEFDALSVLQECRDLVSVVATGTTQGSHTPRWLSLLAQQQRVLVAFDGEDTGDTAAQWWLKRLEHAQRLRPWWKDANQMLQDGANLRDWVASALASEQRFPLMASPESEYPTGQATYIEEPPLSFKERPCTRCGSHDARKHEDGTWLCPCYWTWYAQPVQETLLPG